MKKSSLEGLLVSFAEADFQSLGEGPHIIQQSILPVVAIQAGRWRSIGTCFTIHSHGLVLTARHVLDEAFGQDLGKTTNPHSWPGDCQIGALYMRFPDEGEVTEADLVGGFLPASRIHYNSNIDIAAMQLHLPVNSRTGDLLRLYGSKINLGFPPLGQYCYAFGYHAMGWQQNNISENITHFQTISGARGLIEELHIPMRDKYLLSFPCFRTSARFDGGMSGGPIIGPNGSVIGVVCSSFGKNEETQNYTSYGSWIAPALTLEVMAKHADGSERLTSLAELMELGVIDVDETRSFLEIERDGDHMQIKLKS